MSCKNPGFETEVQSCGDITVKADFPPGTPLYWIVRNYKGYKKHQRAVQAGTDGELTILSSALPAGYLATGRVLRIEIRKGSDYSKTVVLHSGADRYNWILAKLCHIVKAPGDNSPTGTIHLTGNTIPA